MFSIHRIQNQTDQRNIRYLL